VNKKGLHARASAKFVETAAKVSRRRHRLRRADASVLRPLDMGLMMLAASLGSHHRLQAQGEDAQEALRALLT
jgi:phosphocarrier protein